MSKKITEDMVYLWLGSDTLPSEIHEILAELANGEYDPKQMKQDIIATVGEDFETLFGIEHAPNITYFML